MPKRTNEFQKLIYYFKKHISDDAVVTESRMLKDLVTDEEREVDVCIETTVSGHKLLISVECRDHGRKADRPWVEQMKAKHEQLPTDILVLVSKLGFSANAAAAAKRWNISILELANLNDKSVSQLLGSSKSALFRHFQIKIRTITLGLTDPAGAIRDYVVYPARIEDNRIGIANYAVYLSNGERIADVNEIIDRWHEEFKSVGIPMGSRTVGGYTSRMDRLVYRGKHKYCLKVSGSSELWPLTYVDFSLHCEMATGEFSVDQATLDRSKVAWGKGELGGNEVFFVGSESLDGNLVFSLDPDPGDSPISKL